MEHFTRKMYFENNFFAFLRIMEIFDFFNDLLNLGNTNFSEFRHAKMWDFL